MLVIICQSVIVLATLLFDLSICVDHSQICDVIDSSFMIYLICGTFKTLFFVV